MKALFFDSGPVISLAMNNLLWLLAPLKEKFSGEFYITPSVRHELVEKPLQIKRFEFEAVQIIKLIEQGVLKLSAVNELEAKSIVSTANSSFTCKGKFLRIIQDAEIETLVLANESETKTAVVDERTVRLLLEDPESLRLLLEKRLHSPVRMQQNTIKKFQRSLADTKIIRSAELAASAFLLGLFDPMVPKVKTGKLLLLDAVLWGVKSSGCAITGQEIEDLKKLVLNNGNKRQ